MMNKPLNHEELQVWIDFVADAVLGIDFANDTDRIRALELLFDESGNPVLPYE